MLTKLSVKNFKSLNDVELDFSNEVVVIGPNNCGKTSILQALSLWHLAAKKLLVSNKDFSKERPGVPLTRKEIFAVPMRDARDVWSNLTTKNNIEIGVVGIADGQEFDLQIEFKYFNEELVYIRPSKLGGNSLLKNADLMKKINVSFLPPMSGLKLEEVKLLPETIDAKIGEGLTAEVLRNICYLLKNPETEEQKNKRNPQKDWEFLVEIMKEFFMINLREPERDPQGRIQLYYSNKNHKSAELEILSAGRGMQQILLLISYFLLKPETTLLFDEPDAHLEILKQKRIYEILKEMARKKGSQLIVASHSEVVLREAIGSDDVIAFYPSATPHRIEKDELKNLLKSLDEIAAEDYFLVREKGFVLYLEGSTDLQMLRAFAKKLNHDEAVEALKEVFTHAVSEKSGQNLHAAKQHFTALRSAFSNSHGLAIFDGDNSSKTADNYTTNLTATWWKRYELENYFFCKEAFLAYSSSLSSSVKSDTETQLSLFNGGKEVVDAGEMMEKILKDHIAPIALREKDHEFWRTAKASEWIEKILREFYKKIGHSEGFAAKNNFYQLIEFMPSDLLDVEIKEKLDLIVSFAKKQKR